MTVYEIIAQRLWDENFGAEVTTAEKTEARIADVIEDELGRFIAQVAKDKPVAEIVGPIVRATYGDSAELGHYKIAGQAFHLGREGVLAIMGQLAKARLQLEAWRAAREERKG